MVAIDGTGYFSSTNIHCENCLEKKSSDETDSLDDIETAAMVGADSIYVMLLNRRGKIRKIDAIDVSSSGKAFTPTVIEGIQLTHRSDMSLAEAMQDTERCERVELGTNEQSLMLPPYSITRLKLSHPKR